MVKSTKRKFLQFLTIKNFVLVYVHPTGYYIKCLQFLQIKFYLEKMRYSWLICVQSVVPILAKNYISGRICFRDDCHTVGFLFHDKRKGNNRTENTHHRGSTTVSIKTSWDSVASITFVLLTY